MLWKGVLLGLGAAAPIGPVNVEIARRSLRGGFWAGFGVGMGAVTVDVTYAVLLGLGMQWLLQQSWMPWARVVVGVMGAGLLLYLGVGSLLSARRVMGMKADTGLERPRRNYVRGLVMMATNPLTLGFWFVVVPAAAGQMLVGAGRELPILCVGVFVGAMSWVVFFATAMSGAGRLGKRGMLVAADVAGGVILLGFGGYAIIAAWGVWRVACGHL
ncbi:MAG: LysE family transporter [Planctomycetota bacterium]|nr:LysE family transporter [Planctomycetota bacterium]